MAKSLVSCFFLLTVYIDRLYVIPDCRHCHGDGKQGIAGIDWECEFYEFRRIYEFLRVLKMLINFKNKIRYREKFEIGRKSLKQTY